MVAALAAVAAVVVTMVGIAAAARLAGELENAAVMTGGRLGLGLGRSSVRARKVHLLRVRPTL